MSSINKQFSELTIDDVKELVRQTSRPIKTVVWHCSATKLSQDISIEEIARWHKNRGWRGIGYNLYITKDGKIWKGRNWNKTPAHVAGYNSNTLGFCYEGGLNKNGKPNDTRTRQQFATMTAVVKAVNEAFALKEKTVDWKGHRDYSPDLDRDGIIEEWEWMKACPCFNVDHFIKKIR